MSKRWTRDYIIFVPRHACSSNSPKRLETKYTATLDAAFIPCSPSLMVSNKMITGARSASLSAAAAKVASVVSDSVRPQRQQPTRLPRPWDSPGKNTGVSASLSRALQSTVHSADINAASCSQRLSSSTLSKQSSLGPNQNDKSMKRRNN